MRSIVLVCLLFAPGLLQTINVRENSNLVITAETSSDPENDEAVQLIINFPAGTKLSGLTGRAVEVYTNKVVVNAPQSTQLNIAAGQASEVIPCDDGWANFEKTSSCYKLIPDRSEVFHAAEQVCKSNGAHLVSINSMEEFKFVRGIVDYEFGAGVPAWIGLHTNLLTCELEWTDDTAEANITGLNTCYPDPLFCNLEMCVVSAPQPNHFYCTGSHFAGVSCTENKPVICKKPQYGDVDECQDNNGGCSQMCVNLPKLYECQCQEGFLLASDGKTCEEGEQRCEDGWIYYEESNTCFKAFHTPLPYYVAESACQEEDAHLASVHSREEAEFIQILNEHPCTLAWIGLALNETTSTWMWTDGSPYDFKWWQEAENNNIDREKWMTMYYGSECVTNTIPKPAYWNNIVLTGNFLPFICRKAILDR